MSHTVSDEIAEALAQQGLTPRQRHLLTLRMVARGTEPDTVEVDGQLHSKLPWEVDVIAGRKVPARYRVPLVQTGAVPTRIRELCNFAAGGERFVVFELGGAQTDVDVFRDTLLATRKGPNGGLDLPLHGRTIIRDLVEVGGAAFGFARKLAKNGAPVYSFKRYPVEWLEAVHFITRNTPRARQLAAEVALLTVEGEPIVDVGADGNPIFRAPADALDSDLLFVRYEYEHDRAAVAMRMGGTAKDDERVRSRRDFTVDAVISYDDLVLGTDLGHAGSWSLSGPVRPHGWGVVPVSVAIGDGAEEWSLSGEGLVEGAVESLAPINDRSASYLADAAWSAGDPTVIRMDVRDVEREVQLDADELESLDLVGTGDKVLDLTSLRDKPGSVSLLEVDADGVAALDKQSTDIAHLLDRALGVTTRDPESMTGVLSGVALEILNAPMVAQAETLRGFAIRGIADLIRKLETAMRADAALAGPVTLKGYRWPRVFPFTAVDQKATGEALGILLGNKTISHETAVALAAAVVGTEDPDAELARIDKAGREELAKAMADPPPLTGEDDETPFGEEG